MTNTQEACSSLFDSVQFEEWYLVQRHWWWWQNGCAKNCQTFCRHLDCNSFCCKPLIIRHQRESTLTLRTMTTTIMMEKWILATQTHTAFNQLTIEDKEDKTQCQLCKRLAGPIIPLYWSSVVWKRVSPWMWSLWGSQQPFSCLLGHFRHGDNKPTKQLGDPSASVLLTSVRKHSYAKV